MSTPSGAVPSAADTVLTTTLDRPATLGRTRLLCIDGPAGSGKTTLADEVCVQADGRASVTLVHMDDLLEGWRGLAGALPRVAADLVAPLREDRSGRYRRYDWQAGRFAETRVVEPVDLLIIEGVGSGGAAYDDVITTLVWVEVPAEMRLARGIERDGEQVRAHWLTWMADEDELHARERTRDRADVLVDGTGTRPPVLAQRAGKFGT